MANTLQSSWWVPVVRGIFSILFGIAALLFPAEAIASLIWVFGAYALVDGVFTIYHAIAHRDTDRNWHLLEGIVSIIAGIGAFIATAFVGFTLLFVIAGWAIITGVMQLYTAWDLREEIKNEFWLGLAGVMSIIFGILIFFNPLGGAIATIWIVGIYAIAFGIAFIALGLRYRSGDTGTNEQVYG